MTKSEGTPETSAGPSAALLCAGFLLAGMGTVLLGPILPTLSHQWHLPDSQAGLLLFSKFIGAFVGGSTVPKRLRQGILFGLLASCIGFGAFSFATGLYSGALALFIAGIGLGQIIASTNILAGRRYATHTGSALSIINFFWSLGAVLSGLFIAALLPHHSLRQLLLTFAAAFVVIALPGAINSSHRLITPPAEEATPHPLPRNVFLSFGLMLFLYGGLETCLSQWLTTFSIRYATGEILGGQSAIVVLWTALTAGRALTSLILRRVSETTVQRTGLLSSMLLIPILANCSTARSLSISCILLGLSLSPFFPATFALLMYRQPPARVAGFILAVSGLGAAALSWLMGILSTQVGSLRIAMVVPFVAALGLLAVSFWTPAADSPGATRPQNLTTKFPENAGV